MRRNRTGCDAGANISHRSRPPRHSYTSTSSRYPGPAAAPKPCAGHRYCPDAAGRYNPRRRPPAPGANHNQVTDLLEDANAMKYDYIIIGGGSAGCTLAARLTEDAGVSALLLEAGPDYPDYEHLPVDLKQGNNVWRSAYGPHSWGYAARGTPQQDEPIIIPRGKAMGGSSSINGQVLFRGVPEDYDNWAVWGNDEWSFTKVLPYFRRLENDLDFGGDDFHGNSGPIPVRRYKREEWLPVAAAFYDTCRALGFPADPDQNHPDSNGVAARPLNNIDGVRMSTSLTYLSMSRHRLNLTVRGGVVARRILFDGKKAVGVSAESGGDIFEVYGDRIILAGGRHRLASNPAALRRRPGRTSAGNGHPRGPRPARRRRKPARPPRRVQPLSRHRRPARPGRPQHPGRAALQPRRRRHQRRHPAGAHPDDQRTPPRQREHRIRRLPLRVQRRPAKRRHRRPPAPGGPPTLTSSPTCSTTTSPTPWTARGCAPPCGWAFGSPNSPPSGTSWRNACPPPTPTWPPTLPWTSGCSATPTPSTIPPAPAKWAPASDLDAVG